MKTNLIEHTHAPVSFRCVRTLLSVTPAPLLHSIAMSAGAVHYALAAGKRRHYRRNTAPVAALRGERIRHVRAFQNHALNVLEMLKALSEPPDLIKERVSISGTAHIDAALDAGAGCLLATCHFGNWELAGIALSARGYPVTTVAGEQMNASWSDGLKEWKRGCGITVISPGSGYRRLYRHLRENRTVVLHIDGNLFSRGITIPFLGEPRSFPRGPAHISRATRAPVAFAVCRRTGGRRFAVTIDAPLPAPDSDAGERTVTETLIGRMEKCILAEPEQWCIFRGI